MLAILYKFLILIYEYARWWDIKYIYLVVKIYEVRALNAKLAWMFENEINIDNEQQTK